MEWRDGRLWFHRMDSARFRMAARHLRGADLRGTGVEANRTIHPRGRRADGDPDRHSFLHPHSLAHTNVAQHPHSDAYSYPDQNTHCHTDPLGDCYPVNPHRAKLEKKE